MIFIGKDDANKKIAKVKTTMYNLTKLLYLSTWNFENEEKDGVCKKILSQIELFEKNQCQVDFIFIRGEVLVFKSAGYEQNIGKVGNIKKTPAYIRLLGFLRKKKYDLVYNRFGLMDTFYYNVLKNLKRNGAQIMMEIPTYPYKGEKPQGLLYNLMYKWDDFYANKMKRVVDRIVIYSNDKEVFGIPTLNIKNGVNLEKILPVSSLEEQDDTIDLLAVALMQPYHGYERLLFGLKEYYASGGTRKILLHLVGDGPEKPVYERIVSENQLNDYVIFYGSQSTTELEKIYEKADIGVCSLGCYKKNMYWSSELKAREYLAKGIPFISGVIIDIFAGMDSKYYLEFTNDTTWIDMSQVINFYDSIYTECKRTEVVNKIREIADSSIGIEAVMKPVIDYIESKRGRK